MRSVLTALRFRAHSLHARGVRACLGGVPLFEVVQAEEHSVKGCLYAVPVQAGIEVFAYRVEAG